MKTNVNNKKILRFTPVAAAQFIIAAGAIGWIDTDVSATTGTNQKLLWLIIASNAGGGFSIGSRTTGSAVNNQAAASGCTYICPVSSLGHLDLYRTAVDNTYTIVGYLS